MKTINLRWIYPHYRHDEFVEVSDEVWEEMCIRDRRWVGLMNTLKAQAEEIVFQELIYG